mmetsp:Transcript_24282/g.58179  ORF Transcript_24282/g.58179 Transcript_24282/m.58179 type:complete len:224 (+) Transcript_24282:2420-3091(+)
MSGSSEAGSVWVSLRNPSLTISLMRASASPSNTMSTIPNKLPSGPIKTLREIVCASGCTGAVSAAASIAEDSTVALPSPESRCGVAMLSAIPLGVPHNLTSIASNASFPCLRQDRTLNCTTCLFVRSLSTTAGFRIARPKACSPTYSPLLWGGSSSLKMNPNHWPRLFCRIRRTVPTPSVHGFGFDTTSATGFSTKRSIGGERVRLAPSNSNEDDLRDVLADP